LLGVLKDDGTTLLVRALLFEAEKRARHLGFRRVCAALRLRSELALSIRHQPPRLRHEEAQRQPHGQRQERRHQRPAQAPRLLRIVMVWIVVEHGLWTRLKSITLTAVSSDQPPARPACRLPWGWARRGITAWVAQLRGQVLRFLLGYVVLHHIGATVPVVGPHAGLLGQVLLTEAAHADHAQSVPASIRREFNLDAVPAQQSHLLNVRQLCGCLARGQVQDPDQAVDGNRLLLAFGLIQVAQYIRHGGPSAAAPSQLQARQHAAMWPHFLLDSLPRPT
jgi:hypothetical protein